MSCSDVYFSDLRVSPRQSLLDKVDSLLESAGLSSRVKRGDLVAVKLHFGEKGNTSFIRPIFIRRIVEAIKALGAKPFLTDANTLYVGSRGEAVSHIETAIANGFDYAVVGAPIVISDGLRGNSSIQVKIDGVHYKKVAIASEIVNADAIVGVAHFKGHELTGFGGAIKNIGMGCAPRSGKLAQHSTVSPKVKRKRCIACGECVRWCGPGAISVQEKASIDKNICIGCGECILSCPQNAIQIKWNENSASMQEKLSEHCLGALQGKSEKNVFLNFITQVSPACDCFGCSDSPIVRDIGILSSTDPVAIDQASVDLVNKENGLPGTALKNNFGPGEDKFKNLYPLIDWRVQLEHAETIGLGCRTYKLHENIGANR